jgi:hypothetical protein
MSPGQIDNIQPVISNAQLELSVQVDENHFSNFTDEQYLQIPASIFL